jgi:hypothetical protein
VNLIEYDAEKDKSKAEERLIKRWAGSGVPVIDAEGIIPKGCNADNIKNAVEKRRNI